MMTSNRHVIVRFLLTAIVVALGLGVADGVAQERKSIVVKKDPALDALISPDAQLEKIAGGFGFTEGALWVPVGEGGYLLFTDIPGNVIYKRTPDGNVSVHMEKCGYRGVDIWRVGFMQTNGKKPGEPGFEEFPMIAATASHLTGRAGSSSRPGRAARSTASSTTASAPSSPTAGKESASVAPMTLSSKKMARSISPTASAVCACAKRTRAGRFSPMAST
jgi:hypothetical protein